MRENKQKHTISGVPNNWKPFNYLPNFQVLSLRKHSPNIYFSPLFSALKTIRWVKYTIVKTWLSRKDNLYVLFVFSQYINKINIVFNNCLLVPQIGRIDLTQPVSLGLIDGKLYTDDENSLGNLINSIYVGRPTPRCRRRWPHIIYDRGPGHSSCVVWNHHVIGRGFGRTASVR